ncbi:putative metal-dependent phosphoesterases (PHP family) [Aequoribacter fuscus]|uniref:Putative metal-dependent phosphoesterases (PHP family) n=1 Tax=Aequoribacter fuscus TaxID=2518989 RepID=F3KZZ8_9GAMM|nr:PHP domain-containing protein [Aequoribacter fuscus]EGG30364.1 putative metal-dependent phosphoesterases (PHP family) [Aequoribacter fuscus]QHJ88669.1 PHP domain-containing protein [Aequoribacter fuscus]
MSQRLDLHVHSTCSDGALSVPDLLERALAADIQTIALTDHDTIKGVETAREWLSNNSEASLQLISGTELSCVWQGVTIHVVGLNFDVQNTLLDSYLQGLDHARSERAELIASRLEKQGFKGALAGAQAIAGEAQLGRPHFARWLVEAGHCDSMNAAFKRWLGRGKLGDVKVFWPSLEEAVGVVVNAGGVAVLAHPQHYGMTRAKLKRLVFAFAQAGGSALELPLGKDHADVALYVRRLLNECELSVSLGSDFHADSEWGPRLGVDVAVARNLNPVWAGW